MLISLFAVLNIIKRFREAASSSTCSDFHDWFCHENHCAQEHLQAFHLSGWKDLLHHQTKNTQKLHCPNNIPPPEAQQRVCSQTFNSSFQKKWGCYTGPSVLRHVAARKFKLTFFPPQSSNTWCFLCCAVKKYIESLHSVPIYILLCITASLELGKHFMIIFLF